jgi:hypothetical protein
LRGRWNATERTPELTVAKRIEEDANLSFRRDGDWVAPWEVDEKSV